LSKESTTDSENFLYT